MFLVRRPDFALAALVAGLVSLLATAGTRLPGKDAEKEAPSRFIDLSLLVAPDHPCTWPSFPPFQINPYQKIGRLHATNSDVLVLDGNTGTQLDVPPHSVTRPTSGLPTAGAFGLAFTDKIAAWQFGGEACVIDCKDLLDTTPKGRSDLVKKERVILWEKRHRPLGPAHRLQIEEAAAAFDRAIGLSESPAVRAFLLEKRNLAS